MFLCFLAVAIFPCSLAQNLVISNSSQTCPSLSASADGFRGGGALALQLASCMARRHMPLSSLPNLYFGWEGSSCCRSCCLLLVSGMKEFPGFPVALVWQVQVLKWGWGEKCSLSWSASSGEFRHNVLHVSCNWARWWGKDWSPTHPWRRSSSSDWAGWSVGHLCWMNGECGGEGVRVCVLPYMQWE